VIITTGTKSGDFAQRTQRTLRGAGEVDEWNKRYANKKEKPVTPTV
jgi:hypothetical protein